MLPGRVTDENETYWVEAKAATKSRGIPDGIIPS